MLADALGVGGVLAAGGEIGFVEIDRLGDRTRAAIALAAGQLAGRFGRLEPGENVLAVLVSKSSAMAKRLVQ